MRSHVLTLVAVLLVSSTAAMADFGTFRFDLRGSVGGGPWSDTLEVWESTTQIEVAVFGGASSGGTEGANNGVQCVYFDLVGSAIAGVMQSAGTLDTTFSKLYIPYFLNNLGFDTLASGGTGAVGTIAGIGAAQCAPPGPTYYDMPGAFTVNAPHANGQASLAQPDVLIWTGTLNLVYLGYGQYAVQTVGNVNFWKFDTNLGEAFEQNDTLLINVIPEPTTLSLLALGGLALTRRRRG